MVKWPFQKLSDLQPGDKKITLHHLADVFTMNRLHPSNRYIFGSVNISDCANLAEGWGKTVWKRRGRKVRIFLNLEALRKQTVQPACKSPWKKLAATWGRRRYKGGLPVVLYLQAQMNELQPKNANIHRFRTTKMAMPQESSGEPHFHNYYVEHISSCCCRWDLAWDLVSNVGKPGKRPGN